MINTITVSLAANVDLLYPAAVTISGFHIDEAIKTLPELNGQLLAPLGPLSLTDATADGTSVQAPTVGCQLPSVGVADGYACSHGKQYFKASSADANVNFGMYDDEYGRLVLNLGADLLAGNHIVFQFQLRNPYCGQVAVRPCVRANRILTNRCHPANIPRALMTVEEISTADMLMPTISSDLTVPYTLDVASASNLSPDARASIGSKVVVPAALPGEALPLFTRAPKILVANIGQATGYPCATNRISVTVVTSVPLVAAVNITVTITGLKGRKINQDGSVGTAVPMAGPASGSIPIVDPTNVFASSASWNLEQGELVLKVVADSVAGKKYVIGFDLTNPSKEQECAQVFLKISTFCFGQAIAIFSNASSLAEGDCGSFSTSNLQQGVPPLGFGGTPQNVPNGACPLRVVKAKLHTHFVNQSSQYPCTDNLIRVILSSNVPLRTCNAQVTIRGLADTMTNSTEALPVSISAPASSSTVGNWTHGGGVLQLDSSTVVPTSACEVFSFTFTLKNQQTPRSKATVFVEMDGILGFRIASKELTVPSTLNSWYAGLPGITSASLPAVQSWRDPLVVLTPSFTTRKMSQTSPWPGITNTLTVVFASNVPLTVLCSTLKITQLEGACSNSGRKAFTAGSADKAAFKDIAGAAEGGTYLSVTDQDRDIEVGSLTFKPTADTVPGTSYTFSFDVTNPVVAQNSPGIQIRAIGIPIPPTLFNKEMGDTLTSPCDAISLACKWVAGDAAPLKVYAPMFLQKDIAQNTPYPMEPNTLSVTLMTNIPLSAGTLITLSSLSGARTPTGWVVLSGLRTIPNSNLELVLPRRGHTGILNTRN